MPDDVRGDEVRGELDALELSADRLRQRLHGHRLREPGHAFDEEMAPCEQSDDHSLEQGVLTDDHALDLVQHLFEGRIECWLWAHGLLSSLGWGICGASRGTDRHREADAAEEAVARWVGEAR